LPIVETEFRPRTRGDCVDGPRPCPWVGCRYHLALDVADRRVRSTFDVVREIDAANRGESYRETCALDVADAEPPPLPPVPPGQPPAETRMSEGRVRRVVDVAELIGLHHLTVTRAEVEALAKLRVLM
jgi:hypothetical protein